MLKGIRMNCKQCNIELIQSGLKPKLFCSDKCRMQYSRGKRTAVNEQPVSEQIVSEQVNEQILPANYG